MSRRKPIGAALAVSIGLALCLFPASAGAGAGKPEPSSAARSRISPEAKRLDAVYIPLRRVANAVDKIGRTRLADVYCGISLDGAAGKVDVYLTDPARAGELRDLARRLDPKAQLQRVRVHVGAHSKKVLDASRDSMLRQAGARGRSYQVRSVEARYDGSGLTVGVSDVAAARRDRTRLASRIGTDLERSGVVPQGSAAVTLTFFKAKTRGGVAAYNKYDDVNNQIGGDQLYSFANGGTCTAGFAADDSAGRNYLVTAGHCYASGATVITYHSHVAIGNVVSGPYYHFDSELIQGNTSGKYFNDEGEGATPATSVYYELSGGHAYSYVGDMVYQNGVTSSYYMGWTPHGIRVTNSDVTWMPGAQYGWVRGVVGATVNGACNAVFQGDSGGTVFTYNGGRRQLRGIVEALNPLGDTMPCHINTNNGLAWGSSEIGWVEATDILNHYHLTQDTKP